MSLEERLHQAFRDVAAEARSIDTITIRAPRGRRPVSVALVAAATTAAVILASFGLAHILLTGHSAPDPTQSPTATLTTTSPTAASGTPVPQKTVLVDPNQIPTGAPPGIAYYEQPGPVFVACSTSSWPAATGYIHPAPGDGARIRVHLAANQNFGDFTKVGSGYVLTTYGCSGTSSSRRYESDGSVTTLTYDGGFARGPDGTAAVSLKPGQVTLISTAGKTLQTWTSSSRTLSPVAVFADHSVLADSAKTRLLLLPDGTVTQPPPLYRAPTFLVSQLNLANGDVSQQTHCGLKVVEPESQQALWAVCGYDPGPFSPDGTVLAAAARGYSSTGLLAFFDATTGAQLVAFQATTASWNGESISYMTWEDDTHLLALVAGPKAKGLAWFRYGLDGSVERVSLALPVGESSNYAMPRR